MESLHGKSSEKLRHIIKISVTLPDATFNREVPCAHLEHREI